MRYLPITLLLALIASPLAAGEPPLAEKYLHSGKLKQGQKALQNALKESPDDDQARFGLAVIQLVGGVERLGQSLYKYGLKPDSTNQPFLRMPIPENPEPSEITHDDFRQMLERFRRDLKRTERTLTKITDEEVKLPLRLAEIRIDFDADGEAEDRFLGIMQRIMRRQDFKFLEENPEFKVVFDRGDVPWLEAYCNLLSGMLDLYLSADTGDAFYTFADKAFAKPKFPFEGDDAERIKLARQSRVNLAEPERLSRARKSFVRITELNHESWQFIRAETDDDYEWLPNAKQTGVLGLPVTDPMIDSWLAVMTEVGRLFKGERTFPPFFFRSDQKEGGLNLKILMEDPPEHFDSEFFDNVPEKYITDERPVDILVFIRFVQVFNDSTAVGYAAWFN